jgi:hypothetical protein
MGGKFGWEGTKQLLTATGPSCPSYEQIPPTPCFAHRVDAKSPVFGDGTLPLYFEYTQHTHKYRTFSPEKEVRLSEKIRRSFLTPGSGIQDG